MAEIYQANFGGLIALCATLFVAQRRAKGDGAKHSKGSEKSQSAKPATSTSKASQWEFLVVYCLVMGADWLQGPYLYSLYKTEHGVAAGLVSTLFTTGFLSGAASGYFTGSVADQYGRKAACLFFCVAYALSCFLTMIPNVPLLFLGRVLGGLSTSLLFSVFESWMVTDFRNRKLEEAGGDLSRTFGLMSTLNSVVAILSGVSSEWLVSVTGTRKSPFVVSAVLLGAAFCLIWSQWTENYGETGSKPKDAKDKKTATGETSKKLREILTNPRILSLGLASTLFEGSMYLFVFFWTPALESVKTSAGGLPFGVIFASFMASVLAASLAFNAVMDKRLVKYTHLLIGILGTAHICFLLLATPKSEQLTFWIFCLFEAAVGMYWPCMGYLKGQMIDDGIRAQVYSMLRIPLNIFVVVALLLTDGEGYATVFSTCSGLLLLACGALAAVVLNEDTP